MNAQGDLSWLTLGRNNKNISGCYHFWPHFAYVIWAAPCVNVSSGICEQ